MIQRTDWLPANKNMQLKMAQNWYDLLMQKGNLWFVPELLITQLSVAINEAGDEINIPPSRRNAVSYARMRMTFKALTTLMRDIKRRYYFVPPLTEDEIVALGLKPKDTILTPVLAPTGQAEATITYSGRAQLKLRINHEVGALKDVRAYYGYRIYYGVYTADETLPATGMDLRISLFTRRKKELFIFQPGDSGKTACFCIRCENSKGKAGPWGPLVKAIIP